MDPILSEVIYGTKYRKLTDVLAKFNLWIMPSQNTANELKRFTAIRKDKPRSSVTYPSFEPHITLASVELGSPLPLSTIRNAIPRSQHAFPVKFKSVDVGDHYFRSVYINIALDETLSNLHRAVHETLGVSPRTPKYPHMSLVYISDEDAAIGERERYYDELWERQLASDAAEDSIKLRIGTESEWLEGSLMTEVWVMRCIGPVEAWEVLDKFPLTLE